MACSMTPPYALLDAAAATPMTALNMDGDGWSPCVDLVAIEPPSVKQRPGAVNHSKQPVVAPAVLVLTAKYCVSKHC